MKALQLIPLTLFLIVSNLALANSDNMTSDEWLQQLPELLERYSSDGQSLFNNYLQCMDDQRALADNPDSNLLDQLFSLFQKNECTDLLEEFQQQFEQLPDELKNNQQLRRAIEQSL